MDPKVPDPNDWRRQGQERYLRGKQFRWQRYVPPKPTWDHDHCAFCGETFSTYDGDTLEGFVTCDGGYRWVCAVCFEDFRAEFDWELLPPDLLAFREK